MLAAALPECHLLALLAPPPAQAQEAPRSPTPAPSKLPARVVEVADGLEHPWGLAFLPDGRLLVTERPGRLRLVEQGGRVSGPLTGVPQVYARGQGGLLDVMLSPSFPQDRLVYLSFAEPAAGGASTAVARGRLGERGLEDTRVIWRQEPKVASANHWGSRLLFRADGTLFVTLGDRFGHRERAQDLSTTLGKIVRINADGSVPRDNPFVGRGDARTEIWSYGHRNVQSAALDVAMPYDQISARASPRPTNGLSRGTEPSALMRTILPSVVDRSCARSRWPKRSPKFDGAGRREPQWLASYLRGSCSARSPACPRGRARPAGRGRRPCWRVTLASRPPWPRAYTCGTPVGAAPRPGHCSTSRRRPGRWVTSGLPSRRNTRAPMDARARRPPRPRARPLRWRGCRRARRLLGLRGRRREQERGGGLGSTARRPRAPPAAPPRSSIRRLVRQRLTVTDVPGSKRTASVRAPRGAVVHSASRWPLPRPSTADQRSQPSALSSPPHRVDAVRRRRPDAPARPRPARPT